MTGQAGPGPAGGTDSASGPAGPGGAGAGETGGPLAGLLVVDLSRALAGPHAAMMLGDLGARVIKVEAPGGDDSRGWGPPFLPGTDGHEHTTYFLSCNRNKESVVADLKSAAGRDLFMALIERADVLIENFRPGVLDRLGIGPASLHEINRGLVILSITGFGHDGPEGSRAGYDQIAQGEGGLMSVTGPGPGQPVKTGLPVGDIMAGMYGAYGVVAALRERDQTGRGQVVRTSLLAAIVGAHAFQGTRYTVAGEVPGPGGNFHPSICPYGLYQAADGFVQIAVGSDALWQRFAPAFGLGRPEWTLNAARVRDHEAVNRAVDEAFRLQDSASVLSTLSDLGIPAGKVRNLAEVYSWEQTRSQGLVVQVEHAALGPVELPGPTLRFFGPDGQESGRREHLPPPLLDQHGQQVREWLATEPDRPAPG